MEAAFSASERTWISQKDFTGDREIQFLRRHASILLKPELGRIYETMAAETTTQSFGRASVSEDSVKCQIDALGDEFFGMETKKRRRRRKKSESDDGGNVENDHFEDDDQNTADNAQADCNAQCAEFFESGSDQESEDDFESLGSGSEEGDAFQTACNEDVEKVDRTFQYYLFMNFGVDVPPETFRARVRKYFEDNPEAEGSSLKSLKWHDVDLDTSDGFKESEPASEPSGFHSEIAREDTTNLLSSLSELDNLPGPSGIQWKAHKPVYTSMPVTDDVAGPSRLIRPLRIDELSSESLIDVELPGPSGIQARPPLEVERSCTTFPAEAEVLASSSNKPKRCSRKKKESKVKAPSVPASKRRKVNQERPPQRRSLRLQEQKKNILDTSIAVEQTTRKKYQPEKEKGAKKSKAKNPRTAKLVKELDSTVEHEGVDASGVNNDQNQKITAECQGEQSQPTAEPEVNSKEKEEQDFHRIFKKHLEKRRKNADPVRQNALKTILGFSEDQFRVMAAHIDTNVEDLLGAPVSDDSVAKETVMPLLAPPISNVALETNTSLAIFLSARNRLGNFQWSCKNANEQVTDDLTQSFYERKRIRPEKDIGCEPYNMELVSDAIFTISFYHKSQKKDSATQFKEPALAVKIEALGSQTLEELRQHFYCDVDLIQDQIQGHALPDFTIDPSATAKARNTKMNNPCGLFIHKTMYTNKASREDSRYKYSERLLQWARRDRKDFYPGPFSKGDLEETSLIDLTFKCGFPYLFVHEGDCEHLVVIENVRLPNATDLCHQLEYPLVLESNFKTSFCSIDNKRIARFAVRKMKGFPQDPMLLCAECLQSHCYFTGTKVSNFQLYPFLQLSFLF